ncbi:MAG: DUF192 domain-containing protein [Deferrisomatales bacterium]|nr:DUF192 domain-containing protein [Deferrisomatales bacterium]
MPAPNPRCPDRPLLAGLLFLLLAAALLGRTEPCAAGETGAVPFPRDEIRIQTGGGSYRFSVEVARTPAEQQRGLMFRPELAPDAGMLFLHDEERPVSMWMKNTLIPLDMLFLAADGTVVRIAENTEPLSLRTISSGVPVKGVLELLGGTCRKLGIVPGDRVVHPSFSPGA